MPALDGWIAGGQLKLQVNRNKVSFQRKRLHGARKPGKSFLPDVDWGRESLDVAAAICSGSRGRICKLCRPCKDWLATIDNATVKQLLPEQAHRLVTFANWLGDMP